MPSLPSTFFSHFQLLQQPQKFSNTQGKSFREIFSGAKLALVLGSREEAFANMSKNMANVQNSLSDGESGISLPSRRSVVHSSNGMIACTQPLAAEAGHRILRQGGNAAVRLYREAWNDV